MRNGTPVSSRREAHGKHICEIVQNPAPLPLVRFSKLDDSYINETYAKTVDSLNNVVLKTQTAAKIKIREGFSSIFVELSDLPFIQKWK